VCKEAQCEIFMKRSMRTEWFHQAQWGLFMHFLSEAPGGNHSHWGDVSVDSWNRQVEAFDVERLAAQLHELKAGYLYLTLGQNSGYFCSPNATYDRLTGRQEGQSRCSRRDLVADMAGALNKDGIRMMVYLPSHAPMHDLEAAMALKCVPPWDFSQWSPSDMKAMAPARDNDPRIKTFQRHWEAIIREWSERWGDCVCGWWFDGCYYANKLYAFNDEPNFSSFAAAVRAGNKNSLVCWNPGVLYPPETISPEEDYTSGEVNEPGQIECFGRWVDQAQFQMLSYIGQSWSDSRIRFDADELTRHTRNVTDRGGVVTWDIPFNHADGMLTPDVFSLLSEFSRKMRKSPRLEKGSSFPLVRFKTVKPVNGAFSPGIIELDISNPHDHLINGKIIFRLEPEKSFAVLPPLNFELAPATKITKEVTVSDISKDGQVGSAFLISACGGREQSFRFPCRNEIVHPQLLQRYPVYGPNQELLAEIGFTIEAGKLLIAGMVYDSDVKPLPIPWEGSCLEVFMTPLVEANAKLQLFLTPGTSGQEAAILRSVQREWVPLPGSGIRTISSRDGYQVEAELPLTLIAAKGTNPEAIKLEMQLTVNTPKGYLRGTLFGSKLACTTTEFFVTVILKADS